ncbi:unnamed protein product [Rangifer tarandus platyrhynchus]|uniref:Uncharacterized protein n=2 Tax=Rangifer tarandus platyrhynchus TaxID=3082113 RepID=A0ACB0EF66_RANTA|nr:unnamed protein product [Rangifer tarandus platyrhynchus]CAI9699148.1 unnamed protein product [Rangifer tarandus platyrhynchus]
MCGLLTLPWWSLRCFSKPGAAGSGPCSPRPLASHVEWKPRALSGQQVTQVCVVLQVGTAFPGPRASLGTCRYRAATGVDTEKEEGKRSPLESRPAFGA